MPKIPIEKIPLPIPGGPIVKIVVSIIGQALFEALIEELFDWLRHKRPPEADNHPPVPDPEADEIACLTQTYYNTLAISDVALAIKTGSAAITAAIVEQTKAISSLETRLGNLIEVLAFALPYVGWTQSVLKAFFDLLKQNSDLYLKTWKDICHLFTGRRPLDIEVEEIAFPEIDYEADVRTNGFENRDLEIMEEVEEPPPAP